MSANVAVDTGLFDVAGRTALVTGGSRGIGFMLARGLARAGAEVVITARKAEACERAADELAGDGSVLAVPADVTSEEGVRRLTAVVDDRFDGSLDILVNNAGASWGAPLDTFPTQGWDKVLDVNLRAVFYLSIGLLDALRTSATPDRPATIINIGSVAGISVGPMENYPYTASKAALHTLTRHLALRLADEDITVNAIAPGHFASQMSAFLLDDPDARREVEDTIPLGRIGRPDDLVGMALLLGSRAGAYVTGAVIPVDGGLAGCR